MKNSPAKADGQISASALKQIGALEAEKLKRTPVQQKIDSQLLYADKMSRGEPVAAGVATQRVDLDRDQEGRILVDIKADVTQSLLQRIAASGGAVLSSYPEYQAIQAGIPLSKIEGLAAQKEVAFIQPLVRSMRNSVDSEGDVTHQADVARANFGVNGAGVKIGVISDSVDHLTGSQISGQVNVLPGQSGVPDTGEGTAMLEIVHDLAPGAQLFFGTAGRSEAQFASNINSLRTTCGCDIIVDDILFADESPFQDGIVAQAVNAVTAGGALYFSSAGNSGNKDSGTSGTWEGDFVDSGDVNVLSLPADSGHVHSFGGGMLYDEIRSNGPGGDDLTTALFWSDPWGASTDDYDLYVLDSTGNNVVTSSTSSQTGTQNPYEHVSAVSVGENIVIVKFSGAGRFLHLSTTSGELAVNTSGATRGHDCAVNAFNVAATDANYSYPYPFTEANLVEAFSSDGPRRVFFQASGIPITPGNFSSTGGTLRSKPELTAADGVTTDLPYESGLNPFYGTSAAAPHAAAIAALLKSYDKNLTASQIRKVLTGTALDIMAAGVDRDCGSGIIMATTALETAEPDLTRGTDRLSTASPHVGDTVLASLTITNGHCGLVGNSTKAFHVGFYWSTTPSFDGVTPFYEAAISGCAIDGQVVLNQKIPIDTATIPGTYYLGYKIDDENEVLECDEENNGIFFWTLNVVPEITPPIIKIMAPLAGQRWSNSTFYVSGTAGDNVQVSNVWYQMNGLDWNLATTGNNWSNWFALATLSPGTNIIAAYSVDTTGNRSITNRVSFIYVVNTALAVQTSGSGAVSPDYNGALLQIGNSYSMKAAAATGFSFSNWTGSVLTNGTTVRFLMASNLTLQANFVDVARPALSITNIKTGMTVTNAAFTLKGKAGDNVAVAGVYYSLNNTGWSNATTGNHWTNWYSAMTLTPGTNRIAAYAMDASGNDSITNALNFFYAVNAALTVTTNGKGTVSPNKNGAILQIGRSYSITAKAGTGFAFTNWTGGTDLPLNVVTNRPTVRFMMQSNLMLQANFIDVTRPALSITNITAEMNVSNATFTVKGRANDNVGVAAVYYSLNNSGWSNAATGNNWTNWDAAVTLTPGTNKIAAFAVDATGNASSTTTLNFFYVVNATLTVTNNGNGTVSPNDNGAVLQVGRSYSIKATARTGFVFTNWTSGTNLPLNFLTNGLAVQFLMASNLMLQANFVGCDQASLKRHKYNAGIKRN